MMRRIVLALALLLAPGFISTASAQPISRQNPYRSFNITGINYGSQQWERQHHGRYSNWGYRGHAGLFRRR